MISRRPATPLDRPFACATHHAAYREVVERQFGPWQELQQDRFFAQSWDGVPHDILAADGVPVGYCAIEERAHDIHLRELVIAPEAQGRGIGTEVLRQLQESSRQTGKPIVLGTFTENRALALYTRLGFLPIGRTETHILMEWRARG